jgi:anti-sigma B factor antagonist
MDLNSYSSNGILLLEISGKFDGYEAPKVADWLKANVHAQQAKVLVDLSQVSFLDSIALASLVQGMKHCREFSGDLYLCGMQAPVRVVFELTRLDKAFTIFPDRASALQGLSS